MPDRLSPIERRTLWKLSEKGPAGNFDQIALSKLFTLGLVDVTSKDRRLVLTKAGRELCRDLASLPQ